MDGGLCAPGGPLLATFFLAGGGAEGVAQPVVGAAEALGGGEALEAAHTSDAAFDAAVVPFQAIVLVAAGAMGNAPAERGADRPRVGAVPVRGDAVRGRAGGGPRRTEEGLRRRQVAVLAEHGVHEVAISVDGAVEVIPARSFFDSDVI